MELKTIRVMDASGQMVEAQVDLHRYNTWDTFIRQSRVLDGYGPNYGRHGANDAQEATAFLVSQLAYVEPTSYAKEYQPRQYVELLPGSISYTAGEAVKSIEWEIYARAGKGRRSSGNANDSPTVDVSYARKTMPVQYGRISYRYSQEELRVSAFTRKPLSTTKLTAAIEGFEDHMNDVALTGETESNLTGLFNSSLITASNRPSGSNWSSADATGIAKILADVNAGIAAVWNNTFFNSLPVRLVVAPAVMPILQAPRSDNSDKTVMQYLLDNNLAKSRGRAFDIVPGYGLDTAGSGSTKRIMFYSPGDQNLTMHIPLPLRFLAPQLDDVFVKVPGEYKYSGVGVRRPKTALYYDGV